MALEVFPGANQTPHLPSSGMKWKEIVLSHQTPITPGSPALLAGLDLGLRNSQVLRLHPEKQTDINQIHAECFEYSPIHQGSCPSN